MITISTGQALLILLEKFPDSLELKRLYLLGANTPAAKAKINVWLQHEALLNYQVSQNPSITYADSSRRYFETKLAYVSLANTIKKLRLKDLYFYYDALWAMHRKLNSVAAMARLKLVINGNLFGHLYSDYLRYIASKRAYPDFNYRSRDKVKIVVIIFYLAFKLTHTLNNFLPLNIYSSRHKFYGEKGRGRVLKKDQTSVSHALGIIKSTMPIPKNDVVFSSAKSKEPRMPDSYNYDLRAAWIKHNFDQFVHPFSTSISGTMLCQLRVLAQFLHTKGFPYKTRQKLAPLLTCMIASRLYHTGGHTLFEFTSSIELDEAREQFKRINKYKTITLEYMFLTKNKFAFATALKATIQYNHVIMKRSAVHEELLQYFVDKKLAYERTLCTREKPLINSRYVINSLPVYNLKPSHTLKAPQALLSKKSLGPNIFKKFQPQTQSKDKVVSDELSLMDEFAGYSIRL